MQTSVLDRIVNPNITHRNVSRDTTVTDRVLARVRGEVARVDIWPIGLALRISLKSCSPAANLPW